MEIKDLKKLLTLGKQFGVRSIACGEVVVEFYQQAVPNQPTIKQTLELPPTILIKEDDELAKMPPDDEMLYLSTPYFDIQKAQRA